MVPLIREYIEDATGNPSCIFVDVVDLSTATTPTKKYSPTSSYLNASPDWKALTP